ncbi:hypothetical protein BDV41DRAFT_542992 [Aspergillus transmontanensis]|uniref:BZIP domain-containing protein n=1 Tax=Aspergillus transmontanensis TaxID=1034304 RepID=A0A5N6VRE0_9EURO|nr:hypothetical protein BDV41DRAFT_542992 [Aspergillus transmontanensis]
MSHPLSPYTKTRAPEADKSRLGSKSNQVALSPQQIPLHIRPPPEKEGDVPRYPTLTQLTNTIAPGPLLSEFPSRLRSDQAILAPLRVEGRSQRLLSSLMRAFDNNRTSIAASDSDSRSETREPRAGTRKVTSVSAEQLERKRVNVREAQRALHQRTREHIKRLEQRVAELKSKGEQYDTVVRKNMALENEIRALKQQLALARDAHTHVAQTAQAYSDPAEWPVAGGEQLGVSSGTGGRKKPNNKPYRVIKNTISEDLCKGEVADRMAKIRKYQVRLKRGETRISMPLLSSSGKGLRSKQNHRKI